MFPDFSYYEIESVNLSNRLLNEAGIGSVPGIEFGLSGENHLRILFTSPPKEIARGLERMQSFFKIL
jgi:aspartate/methionine/tyrosine aminotransferase